MYILKFGTETPTDCTLVLEYNGIEKEYGIESIAWNLLSHYCNNGRTRKIPQVIANDIWFNRDDDLISIKIPKGAL